MLSLGGHVLPIAKFPYYLSPSALMMFETQPHTFYLQRMAPRPLPRDPQGAAASVGSAFDSFIKDYLAKKMDMTGQLERRVINGYFGDKSNLKDMNVLEMMLYTSVECNKEEAIRVGKVLKDKYLRYAPELTFCNLEIVTQFQAGDVPIYIKGDASVWDDDDDREVPHDWKVMGFGSKSGASPLAGYQRAYDGSGLPKVHKDYHEMISMEQINEKWATQLATYGWEIVYGKVVRPEEFIPYPAYIDALVIRPTGVRVVRYRGWITVDFQKRLYARYHNAWNAIRDGSFVKGLGEFRMLVECVAETESWW